MSAAQAETPSRVVIVDTAAIAARGDILFPGARVVVANGRLPPEALGFSDAVVPSARRERIDALCSALVAAGCPSVREWEIDLSTFTTRQAVLKAAGGIKPYRPNAASPSKSQEDGAAEGAPPTVRNAWALKRAAFGLGGDPDPDGPVICTRLSDIESKPIRWLWPGRIARGKVSMIAGHPGLGKSQITNSIAAICTQGGQWPVDRTRCESGNAIFLSAEDDPADTIRPRLEAAGADIKRVFILQAIRDGFDADGGERRRAFNLKADIRRLEALIVEIGDVTLIVIDPVSAYLGGTDSHNNADVRTLLAPLGEMAARTGVAIVAVSHLNKGSANGGADALLRITGSLAFVAASRAAFIVAKDPANDSRRLFLPAKNNIGPDVGGLAFGIEPVSIGHGIETSRVVWEAEAVQGISADEVLRPAESAEDHSALDDAKAWTEGMLAEGPMPSKRFMAEGRDAGHSERTLMRARRTLGVDAVKEGRTGPWMLRLPLKAAKNPEECQVSMAGNVGSLGSLEGSSTPSGPDEEPVA